MDHISITSRRSRTSSAAPARPHATAVARVLIRPATKSDVAAITSLRLALLSEESLRPLSAEPANNVRHRARELTAMQVAGDREIVFVAVTHRRVIGTLRCVAVNGSPLLRDVRHAILTTAYVRPKYRRRGVLARMLGAADDWCRARGLRDIRLHCAIGNTDGNAAWSALGFRPVQLRYCRDVPVA
jgi:GNAT superfamily N-acetyltransferase